MSKKTFSEWYASLTEEQREIKREQARQYKKRNRKILSDYQKTYYAKNKDKANEVSKIWRKNNPEKFKEYEKKRDREVLNALKRKRYASLTSEQIEERKRKQRERYANDPSYAIQMRLRASLTIYLKKNGVSKSKSIRILLGCDIETFRLHLTSLFQEGMNWENRNLWEIDHIRPCASFDLTKEGEQEKCFHYTNLQPLWMPDNRKKGKKWSPSPS